MTTPVHGSERPPNTGRIRTATKACDSCSARKVRCEFDARRGSCPGCIRRNIKCVITTERRKPKMGALERKSRMATLENRINKLNKILQNSGLQLEAQLDKNQSTEHVHSVLDDPPGRRPTIESDDEDLEEDHAGGTDLIDKAGESRTPFDPSVDSIGFLQNYADSTLRSDHHLIETMRTGEAALQTQTLGSLIDSIGAFGPSAALRSVLDGPLPGWCAASIPELDLCDPSAILSLPSYEEARPLIHRYFAAANIYIPIWCESDFLRLVRMIYTSHLAPTTAIVASLHIMLAIAYDREACRTISSPGCKSKARQHFQQASALLPKLMFESPSVSSIQAMLGISFYIMLTGAASSSLPLVTASLRACYQVGLHQRSKDPNIGLAETRQRRRVFWIAYILDHRMSLRTGVPPMQHFDDLESELTDELPWLDLAPQSQNINSRSFLFFKEIGTLSLICNRAAQRLYSNSARAANPEAMKATVRELNQELQDLYRAVDPDDRLYQEAADADEAVQINRLAFKAVYFHAVIFINQSPNLQASSKKGGDPTNPPNSRPSALESDALSEASKTCVEAALSLVDLVQDAPETDIFGLVPLALYIFRATSVIFTEVLAESKHTSQQQGLRALGVARAFFLALDARADGTKAYTKRFSDLSAGLERIAMNVAKHKTVSHNGPSSMPWVSSNIPPEFQGVGTEPDVFADQFHSELGGMRHVPQHNNGNFSYSNEALPGPWTEFSTSGEPQDMPETPNVQYLSQLRSGGEILGMHQMPWGEGWQGISLG